ncbi:hypothetical protein HG535_0C06150 [Zygotorulaspora mrakii]|uniref:THIF-type NAD/FAD binding fold domain-containing protein n=1 Tax=Zygotorulaspora mrakii TaxID=42260 RepID=A0A7H9B0W2_ZYGMR|nr:uncharacterized protein HG535_0C06150 [Zygotorulaspora mrakii]QLG72260.1 hypothetical protein HG535_0C06150 [Zygotorulaspora mrakii]
MITGDVDSSLSADEIALYDRQIRLWGMAAQARMRLARVLLINLSSIGTEICKNIVLSGLGSLCILDSHAVTEEDLGSQFYLSKQDVGLKRLDAAKNRILDLNPRVNVTFDVQDFSSKPLAYFKDFDLVIGTQLTKNEMVRLNEITRHFNLPIYLTGSNGLFGYIFVDLIEFHAEEQKIKSAKATAVGRISDSVEVTEVVEKKDEEKPNKVYEIVKTKHTYKPFVEVLSKPTLKNKLSRRQSKRLSPSVPLTLALFSLDEMQDELTPQILKNKALEICERLEVPTTILSNEYVEQFVVQRNVEFTPISAILGGAVAQDVINILGKRQTPLKSTTILDGITLDMPMFEF